jgi:hypothetical protein
MKRNTPILFDDQPRLTHADRKRLQPHMSGWNRLCSVLEADILSEADLKKLVLIEFEGAKRPEMVQKVLGKLSTSLRKRVLTALHA